MLGPSFRMYSCTPSFATKLFASLPSLNASLVAKHSDSRSSRANFLVVPDIYLQQKKICAEPLCSFQNNNQFVQALLKSWHGQNWLYPPPSPLPTQPSFHFTYICPKKIHVLSKFALQFLLYKQFLNPERAYSHQLSHWFMKYDNLVFFCWQIWYVTVANASIMTFVKISLNALRKISEEFS